MRLLIILAFLLVPPKESFTEHWMVTNDSKIIITGSTNVNSYKCILAEYRLEEELVTDENQRGYEFSKGRISLEIEIFDCGHSVMNKDFYETLNSDEYPTITLTLSKIFLKTEINGFGIFEIEISGERKEEVIIDLEIYKTINSLNLSGKKRFQMSDFGIEPPSKLFGMIQVDDMIQIEFNLVLSKIIS